MHVSLLFVIVRSPDTLLQNVLLYVHNLTKEFIDLIQSLIVCVYVSLGFCVNA